MTVPPVWLTQHAYEMLRQELTELLRDRSLKGLPAQYAGDEDGDDSLNQHDPLGERDRDQRIRRLQEILLNSFVEQDVPDDGIAEPGMVLTVRYDNESDIDIETFLLGYRVVEAYEDVEVCSPDSPLGRALCGAREGQWCRYRLPDGTSATVQLIRAVPYRTRETAVSASSGDPSRNDHQAMGDELARRRQQTRNTS